MARLGFCQDHKCPSGSLSYGLRSNQTEFLDAAARVYAIAPPQPLRFCHMEWRFCGHFWLFLAGAERSFQAPFQAHAIASAWKRRDAMTTWPTNLQTPPLSLGVRRMRICALIYIAYLGP